MAGPVKDLVGVDPSDYVRAEIVATLKDRLLRAEVVLKITDTSPSKSSRQNRTS
jgi:hypothetical protein